MMLKGPVEEPCQDLIPAITNYAFGFRISSLKKNGYIKKLLKFTLSSLWLDLSPPALAGEPPIPRSRKRL